MDYNKLVKEKAVQFILENSDLVDEGLLDENKTVFDSQGAEKEFQAFVDRIKSVLKSVEPDYIEDIRKKVDELYLRIQAFYNDYMEGFEDALTSDPAMADIKTDQEIYEETEAQKLVAVEFAFDQFKLTRKGEI